MTRWVTRPDRRGKTRLEAVHAPAGASGRSLGWAEWGDERGRPVLLFTGPGTSASLGFGAEILERLEVRLIAVDRPGLGLSDPASEPSLAAGFDQWVADVRALIEARGFGRCPAIGFSQGAPFALACAAAGVVSAAAIVSGSDELARPDLRARLPEPMRELVDQAAREPDSTEAWLAAMTPAKLWALITDAGPEDRVVYLQPSFAAALRRALDEGFARGSAGYARDTLLALRPWTFAPEAIAVPVDLWYGERDDSPSHSPDHGESLAARIPTARRTLVPEAGGALLWTHAPEILRALLY